MGYSSAMACRRRKHVSNEPMKERTGNRLYSAILSKILYDYVLNSYYLVPSFYFVMAVEPIPDKVIKEMEPTALS